ncbi:MAG: CoA-binding protein [Burkholderiales bacterium]|nr:CoA-binding protein [Burkholderiales bacterium]
MSAATTASPSAAAALDAFHRPASVAIVGAGDRPTSSGGAVLRNLLEVCGWPGRVVPVNPKGGVLFGRPVARTLAEVDPPCDLVAVLVRPDAILDVVREAAASGHRRLMILPGGFAEAGADGAARDAQLRALAVEHDLVVGGPNCAGIVNLFDPERRFAVTFFRDVPRGGPVALVSQSGAVAEEMITASRRDHVALGAVVSVGNAMHLDLADHVDWLGRDPRCGAVLLYAETFGDTARFLAIARAVSATRPVAALVAGRTPPGRDAAWRHTGSRALDPAAADAFCRDAGVLRVDSLRELALAGKVLARFPRGIGPRVLILSNSGGPGVLAADRAVAVGLDVVALPDTTAAALRAAMPPEAAVANPVDLLADARDDRFGAALRIALDTLVGHVDAILMIHVIPFMVDGAAVVRTLCTLAQDSPLPLLHSMMGTLDAGPEWFAQLAAAGVPAFDDTEDMVTAAGLLARRRPLHDALAAAEDIA